MGISPTSIACTCTCTYTQKTILVCYTYLNQEQQLYDNTKKEISYEPADGLTQGRAAL